MDSSYLPCSSLPLNHPISLPSLAENSHLKRQNFPPNWYQPLELHRFQGTFRLYPHNGTLSIQKKLNMPYRNSTGLLAYHFHQTSISDNSNGKDRTTHRSSRYHLSSFFSCARKSPFFPDRIFSTPPMDASKKQILIDEKVTGVEVSVALHYKILTEFSSNRHASPGRLGYRWRRCSKARM